MHSLSAFLPALILLFPLFPSSVSAGSQNITIPGLSPCWQQCLDSSSGSNCDSSSVDSYTSCICNLASQSLLTNAITCVQSTCPSTLTSRLPIEFLQHACTIAGKPLDSSALAAAESAESSAAVVSEYSDTTSSDGGLYGAAPVTATEGVGSATAITVDGSSASSSGGSLTGVTSSGTAATPMSLSSSSSSGDGASAGAGAGASPSTSFAGSTFTAASSVSEMGTTDTAASRTATPSSSQATSHSSTAGADSAVKTEGAPLGMQGTGTRKDAGSVLGLTVWLIAGIAWF